MITVALTSCALLIISHFLPSLSYAYITMTLYIYIYIYIIYNVLISTQSPVYQ